MLKRFIPQPKRPKTRAGSLTMCRGKTVRASRPLAKRATKPEGRAGRLIPGSAAEARLVEEHLALVKNVVGRLAMTLPSHVDADDLYSAGLVGLLKAIRNFNPESGTSLETYARLRIRGAVLDELRNLDWVPRSVHSRARKVQAVLQQLEQVNGAVPSEIEMARAMKLSLAEYQQLLLEIRPATFVCLDAALYAENEDGSSQHDCFADQQQDNPLDNTSRREQVQLVVERLQQLPDAQRKVLALYYFEGLRLREIAEVFGLTESRICQIHSQAVLALKSYLQKYDCCGV